MNIAKAFLPLPNIHTLIIAARRTHHYTSPTPPSSSASELDYAKREARLIALEMPHLEYIGTKGFLWEVSRSGGMGLSLTLVEEGRGWVGDDVEWARSWKAEEFAYVLD